MLRKARRRLATRQLSQLGLILLLLFPVLWLLPTALHAHEATMVDLRVRELAPGDFIWTWGIPSKGRPVSEDLSIRWPSQCEVKGQAMRCGSTGLDGMMTIDGVGRSYSAVMMHIYWYSGNSQVVTLTEAIPGARLFAGGQDARSIGEIAKSYGALGVEHILTGWDHLLFVISLVLLVGMNRRLIVTITAFTVAHSLTLAASALGLLTLRSAPVEASIALSIMLVSGESLRQRNTLSRRFPALVAMVFGLVHGLGFAGALKEIGLPEAYTVIALLTFNLGVEAGQLMLVLACWGLAAVFKPFGKGRDAQPGGSASEAFKPFGGVADHWVGNKAFVIRLQLYAIGSMGAYWTISRVVAIVTGS
ncbi:MAG: HupE/UreJ family protein [Betaproteobacteria bacterium]|nr:HupE/UreJ family protein [Betaproteobacteria bacterium]NCW50048.1 HupE/UreJ family protein [Betaproteobacteria bacterium]NCX72689.1 HupE/UreJ family protein [Betaproteobacteria bacterium]NDA33563.1 HupE/UreJ family protein [Betaproteobacteria bacterium]NDC69899.1 HupE/UreJ family protein [Betaproteobacteria bacterium]